MQQENRPPGSHTLREILTQPTAWQAALREMRALGGQTLVLSDQPVPVEAADDQVNFHAQLPNTHRGVLYLPVLQLLGYYRALKNPRDAQRERRTPCSYNSASNHCIRVTLFLRQQRR